MARVQVSTVKEVLEQLRLDVVADLQRRKMRVPQDALVAGACDRAVAAWIRLENRSVAAIPRTVHESPELLAHKLDAGTRATLATIRSEFERGDDVTHRLMPVCSEVTHPFALKLTTPTERNWLGGA